MIAPSCDLYFAGVVSFGVNFNSTNLFFSGCKNYSDL
jgi:hypothetical protein